MTKILYIPNGEYLKFFSDCYITDISKVNWYKGRSPEEILKDIINDLNGSGNKYNEWRILNNIGNSIVTKSEFEIIYDN